ncbi:PadR family transcriptional regulator [Acinetobacter baumannii]|uniref:PadR family transcriptional regulator n=2 Tax=Acinetobacter baumannii TaxID=470 RepID=A0A1S2FPK6_ACIBA|nr:PadR family transcriptional regulator [Acinetobacter baumannii]ARG19120.1 PadR family transcriptional regulator [Acinetobacter baumannii]AYY54651.1 PadR family transcriptional regulator [Acinetobacter baumannii]EHU3344207.1 PadR family transcriptional regulator [Acinetobacter baumannii]EHU3345527.1 PadR family transcriptional regulator [Acinetobacter baumannii]EKP55332.1 transcriptional regulator, PadR family [Acinetobacter baumannii Naval-82]
MRQQSEHHYAEHNDHHHGHHRSGRRGRLFEAGRMKLLVLHLIQQNPKHGYEIIKEISDLVGDGYTPSAGTIYPTLTSLEEMNLINLLDVERKQYQITEFGEAYLNEHQDKLSGLLEKLRLRREIHSNDQLIEIHRAMENLKTALRLKLNTTELKQEQIYQIAEKIDQAAVAIGRL